MDVGLNGKCLQSVLTDYTVRLQFSDAHFVVISSPFRLDSRAESALLSPEDDTEEAFLPIRQLAGQTVDEATADESGTLRVRFNGGTVLLVPPDDAYEAWNVSGPGGALVVSTPGGALAIWTARTEP